MYPSEAYMVTNNSTYVHPEYAKYCSVYGYSYGNATLNVDNKSTVIESGQYFAFFIKDSLEVKTDSNLFLVIKLGYKVVNQIGWVEDKGRLSYIDGCSDSLLVYPSRMGDPSLNLLYFPIGVDQSFHIHPSIRIGCVIDGSGQSDYVVDGSTMEHALDAGDIFCLEEQELHRFKTKNNHMRIIAWHPDGDWGPTDHNHTMLNRTYINK